jgi:hypothetical protein
MLTRNLLPVIILFVSSLKLVGQATEKKLDFKKKQLSAATITWQCKRDVAEKGLEDYMARKGIKPSSYKGLIVYRNVPLDSTSKVLNDLYFKFDKSNDATVATLVPTKQGEEFETQAGADQATIDQAKSFLNQLAPTISSYNTGVQLAGQQEVLNKANKKLKGLLDDSTDLAKKIRNLQSDLDQNKNDLDNQKKVLDGISTTDFDAHQKAVKKLNSLSDDRGSLEKKLRKAQSDFEQNKQDLATQRQLIQKEEDANTAIKSKQQ